MAYFTDDFAGRIANKVVDGGAALRDPLRSTMSAIWYCGFFIFASIVAMMRFDVWLALPTVIWLAAFIASLVYFVPRVRALQLFHARQHTALVGHVNDIFSNIGLVKLFGREHGRNGRQSRRARTPQRRLPRHTAQDLADGRHPYRAERRPADRLAGAGSGAMAGGPDFLRRRGDGRADGLADREHVGLDPQRGHDGFRDPGAGRGMHGDDRAALHDSGRPRRPRTGGPARRRKRSSSATSASITADAASRGKGA